MVDISTPPEYIGVPTATLQAWLTAAQQALQDLTAGGKAYSVSYSQGDGSKAVTYTQADIAALRMRIRGLTAALGLTNPRRAIRPVF